MTFIRGPQARLVVTLPVLAGLLAPMAAAQGLPCTDPSSIKFSGALEPLALVSDHVVGNYGLRGLIVWIHGVFGAIVLPSQDPMELLKAKRAELQSGEYGAVVWSLVRQNAFISLLVVTSLITCVVLPIIAIAAVICHRVCWCCSFWPRPDGRETLLERRSRKKWTNVFYAVVVLMSFTVIGALATKGHFSRASVGAIDQARFLITSISVFLNRLFQELNVLVDTNVKEFKTAVLSRADTCTGEAVSDFNDMVNKDTLMKFVVTTALRLQTIEEKLTAINALMSSSKIAGVRARTDTASSALKEAAGLCAGCDANTVDKLTRTAQGLDFSTALAVPQPVKELEAKLKTANIKDQLSKIPTGDKIKEEIKGLMGEVQTAVGGYEGEIGKAVKAMRLQANKVIRSTNDSLISLEVHVKRIANTVVGWYEILLTLLLFVMTIIVGQYIAAVQAQMWHINQGFFGFYMGSWMLWTAVVLFQLLFPLVFAVSTLTMAVGTVFDRLICVPAQHPGSESSRAIIDFVLNLAMKTSARAGPDAKSNGRQRHATAGSGSTAQQPSLLSKLMQSPWQDGAFSLEVKAFPDGMAQYYWPFNDSGLAPLLPEGVDADGNVSIASDGAEIEAFRAVSLSQCPHTRGSEGPEHESFGEDASYRQQNTADVHRLVVRQDSTVVPTSSQNTFGTAGSMWQEDAVTNDQRGNGGGVKTYRRASTSPTLWSMDADVVRRRRGRQQRAQKNGERNVVQDEDVQSVQGYRGLQRQGTTASEVGDVVQREAVEGVSMSSGSDGWDEDHRRKRSTRTRITSRILRTTEADGATRLHKDSQWQDETTALVRYDVVRRFREILQSQEGKPEFMGGDVAQRPAVVHGSNSVSGTTLDRREDQMVTGQLVSMAVLPRERIESVNYRQTMQRQEQQSGEQGITKDKSVEVVHSGRRLQRQGGDEVSRGSDVVFDQRVANGNSSAPSSSWRRASPPFLWLLQRQPDERTEKNRDATRAATARHSLLSVELGQKVVLDITKRFGECSSSHMSLYKLLGEDAAVEMAKTALGTESTILGLIDSKMSNAKLDELKSKLSGGVNSKIETKLKEKLGIGDEVKGGLSPLSTQAGGVAVNFEGLTKASTDAISAFSKISTTKSDLRNYANQLPLQAVKDKLNVAADELERITSDEKKGFEEDMTAIGSAANALAAASVVDGKKLNEYLDDNLNVWDANKAAMEASVQTLVDSVKGMTKGFEGDVEQFFTQAKTQVRDNIGDCHSIYVMYITTANTICDGAVKPFAAFWFMVWWYLVLGIPAWMVALALSSYYAKLSP